MSAPVAVPTRGSLEETIEMRNELFPSINIVDYEVFAGGRRCSHVVGSVRKCSQVVGSVRRWSKVFAGGREIWSIHIYWINFLFLYKNFVVSMEVLPSQTIYVNNLNEKVDKRQLKKMLYM